MAVRAPIFHPPQSPAKQNFLFPHNRAMSLYSNRVFMQAYTIARFLLFLALCLVESTARQRVFAGELRREANSTLALPLAPHQYAALEAFPGLSFDDPAAMVSAPGDSNRLFILERSGRIQVITNLNSPNKTLFLDISGRVHSGGEGGSAGIGLPSWLSNQSLLFPVLHAVHHNCGVLSVEATTGGTIAREPFRTQGAHRTESPSSSRFLITVAILAGVSSVASSIGGRRLPHCLESTSSATFSAAAFGRCASTVGQTRPTFGNSPA